MLAFIVGSLLISAVLAVVVMLITPGHDAAAAFDLTFKED